VTIKNANTSGFITIVWGLNELQRKNGFVQTVSLILEIKGGCKLHSAQHTISILSFVAYDFSYVTWSAKTGLITHFKA